MKQNETQNEPETSQKYYCTHCDYTTSKNGNWKRHEQSIKHKTLHLKQNETKTSQKRASHKLPCDTCHKTFGSRTTLWRHHKKCIPINKDTSNSPNKFDLEKTLTDMSNVLKKSTVSNINYTQHANTVNNNININIFLNERCANALSIQDFTKTMQLTMMDLMIAKNDKAKGITDIVLKNLKPLTLTQRPVHCIEGDEWFVKDERVGWEKDSNKVILATEHSIRSKWSNIFEERYPNWIMNEQLSNDYIDMASMAMSKLSDKDKKKVNKKVKHNCNLSTTYIDRA